ncbi:MAG: hypothetical protein ACT4PL_11295 [Phycisphaerales bacterium]
MLALCAALIFSLVAAALALWAASALGLDAALFAWRRQRLDSLEAFLHDCLNAAAGGTARCRIVQRAFAEGRTLANPEALRAELEAGLDQRMSVTHLERGSLVRALPLIAVGAITLGAAGLLSGGLQPNRLDGLPMLALLIMLFAAACVLARAWVFANRRTGAAERLLREALAIEAAVAARAGLNDEAIRRRLTALIPDGALEGFATAQPSQTAETSQAA